MWGNLFFKIFFVTFRSSCVFSLRRDSEIEFPRLPEKEKEYGRQEIRLTSGKCDARDPKVSDLHNYVSRWKNEHDTSRMTKTANGTRAMNVTRRVMGTVVSEVSKSIYLTDQSIDQFLVSSRRKYVPSCLRSDLQFPSFDPSHLSSHATSFFYFLIQSSAIFRVHHFVVIFFKLVNVTSDCHIINIYSEF